MRKITLQNWMDSYICHLNEIPPFIPAINCAAFAIGIYAAGIQ